MQPTDEPTTSNAQAPRRGFAHFLRSFRWQAAGVLLAGSALCLLARAQSAGDEGSARVDVTRSALEKWVETRRLISKEKQDQELGREMLVDRIELVRNELDALRAKITEAEASITEADVKLAGLLEQDEQQKQTASALAELITGLEGRTRELLVQLPDPLRERVKLVSQRIPEDPASTKLGLGERFLSVIAILNEVNKANREVLVTSEVRTLADGTTAEVTSLYIGIGQGYYVTATGDAAGMGSGSAEGWVWTRSDAAAPQIAAAIAIQKGEGVARFVQLPTRID